MKINWAIHFPLSLSRYFQLFFSTHDEFLNIFNLFFYIRYARVEKYIKNVSKFILCKKKSKISEQTLKESELPG